MRTTIRIPDDLMRAVKRRAVDTDRTLTEVITDALRVALARSPRAVSARRTRLPTVGGHGVQPGVDLDDSAALLERMEGVRDPP